MDEEPERALRVGMTMAADSIDLGTAFLGRGKKKNPSFSIAETACRCPTKVLRVLEDIRIAALAQCLLPNETFHVQAE